MPTESYTEEIEILSNPAQAIRARPTTYVGPLPNPAILNRLVEEALCLSVDEAHSGNCSEMSSKWIHRALLSLATTVLDIPWNPIARVRFSPSAA